MTIDIVITGWSLGGKSSFSHFSLTLIILVQKRTRTKRGGGGEGNAHKTWQVKCKLWLTGTSFQKKPTNIIWRDYGGADSPCLSVNISFFSLALQPPTVPRWAALGKWMFEATGVGTVAGTGHTTLNAWKSKCWLLVVTGVPLQPVARQDWDTTLVRCYTRHTNRALLLRGFQLDFFLLGLSTREAKAKTVLGKGVRLFCMTWRLC